MNRYRLIAVSFAGILAACYSSQQSACGTGPTPVPVPSPTATPVVILPSPSPTPTPVSCVPDWLRIEGPAVLPQRESARYWLTPMQNYTENGEIKTRQVPDACNVPKASSVRWSFWGQFDGIYATKVDDGFSTLVTRVGISAITLEVRFEGLVANKAVN